MLRTPPALDPITLELVHEGLIAIVREMRAHVVRTAYSSIIYEGYDFSCVMVDADGRLVAQTTGDHPLHIFPIPWSVQHVLQRFGGDINPGDAFLHNDPYTGGTHLNDVALIYPVFLEDGLVAFTVVRAHWQDIGGMTPASISGRATEIYQEGLRIPPLRVYDGGRPNQAAIDLVFANVRDPRQRLGDFTAALTSCERAARKLQAVAAKYGAGVVRTCLERFVRRAEARMRARIAAVPDGHYAYEAYVESQGQVLEPLRANLTLTVHGEDITADFAGSSPQTNQGPTNVGPAMAPSAVFTVVKSYLDRTEAVNHGAWLPLHVHVPEGSFLNARLPAACGGMVEARYAADTAVMGALAAAVPELATGDNKGCANHLSICGRDAQGQLFMFFEYAAGGTGAWSGGDGNNTMRNFQEGDFTSIYPVEAVENEHPLLIERLAVREDSAGAGRWRGGFGLQRAVRLLADQAVLMLLSDRNILGPHGVCGGEAGAGNRFTVRRGGREIEPSPVPGKTSGFPLEKGDVVIMRTTGGGGYGDPLDRPAELVWRDVVEGYVSRAAVRARYGVVVTPAGVDEPATAAERAALRAGRVYATLAPWDGPEFAGARRILSLARAVAGRAGIAAGDVVELVPPQGAPLRAWAHLLDASGDDAYLGPRGLEILRALPGDRVWLRRLRAWGPPPLDS